ncbi:MAG: hypothetical protein KZQ83_14905 [gamma proteobacterium symbiont of Taylorina sp.]|nr:hypothetical protein [gamma proteobacterium symbiont of Taylorina sp.]
MTIKRTTPITRPALNYDKDHVDHFILKISRKTQKLDINMHTVPYASDGETRLFVDKEHEEDMSDPDFEATAISYAVQSGQAVDLADALEKSAAAKVAVQSEIDLSGIDIFTHFARFEAALAEIKNILGDSTSGIS